MCSWKVKYIYLLHSAHELIVRFNYRGHTSCCIKASNLVSPTFLGEKKVRFGYNMWMSRVLFATSLARGKKQTCIFLLQGLLLSFFYISQLLHTSDVAIESRSVHPIPIHVSSMSIFWQARTVRSSCSGRDGFSGRNKLSGRRAWPVRVIHTHSLPSPGPPSYSSQLDTTTLIALHRVQASYQDGACFDEVWV